MTSREKLSFQKREKLKSVGMRSLCTNVKGIVDQFYV